MAPGDGIQGTEAQNTKFRIAFSNNGGIRSALEVGEVLYDDVLYILPFDNTVDLVTMRGGGIRTVLERMCERINPANVHDYSGGFGYQVPGPTITHQVAGLNFEVLVAEDNQGERVNNLRVQGADGAYTDIQEDAVYNVALPR